MQVKWPDKALVQLDRLTCKVLCVSRVITTVPPMSDYCMIQNLEGENFGKMAHSKDLWITSENTQNTRRLKTALAMLKIIKFYVLTT